MPLVLKDPAGALVFLADDQVGKLFQRKALTTERKRRILRQEGKEDEAMFKFGMDDTLGMTELQVAVAVLREVQELLGSVQGRSNPAMLDYMAARVGSALYRVSEDGAREASEARIDAEQLAGESRYRRSVLGDEA